MLASIHLLNSIWDAITPYQGWGFWMHYCIIYDCCIIYGLLQNPPCIIYVMKEFTVINGLTYYNESVVSNRHIFYLDSYW